jgi:hypothetical protein
LGEKDENQRATSFGSSGKKMKIKEPPVLVSLKTSQETPVCSKELG